MACVLKPQAIFAYHRRVIDGTLRARVQATNVVTISEDALRFWWRR